MRQLRITKSRFSNEKVAERKIIFEGDAIVPDIIVEGQNRIIIPNIRNGVETYIQSKIVIPSKECEIDYCYNYFHQTENLLVDIDKSCLVLSNYLKQQTQFGLAQEIYNVDYYRWTDLIEYFQELKDCQHVIWRLDLNQYSSENIYLIHDIYMRLTDKLTVCNAFSRKAIIDYVSNMMMAVFGCMPGFDSHFNIGFREMAWKANEDAELLDVVDVKSLNFIAQFYDHHREEIDELTNRYSTATTGSSGFVSYPYTRARIVDMYAYQCAQILSE